MACLPPPALRCLRLEHRLPHAASRTTANIHRLHHCTAPHTPPTLYKTRASPPTNKHQHHTTTPVPRQPAQTRCAYRIITSNHYCGLHNADTFTPTNKRDKRDPRTPSTSTHSSWRIPSPSRRRLFPPAKMISTAREYTSSLAIVVVDLTRTSMLTSILVGTTSSGE